MPVIPEAPAWVAALGILAWGLVQIVAKITAMRSGHNGNTSHANKRTMDARDRVMDAQAAMAKEIMENINSTRHAMANGLSVLEANLETELEKGFERLAAILEQIRDRLPDRR